MSGNGLENFANVVTVLAALGGVFIAWLGLNTWKAQSKWNLTADLARKILVLIYKHKDAMSGVRNPAIWSGETIEATAGKALPTNPDEKQFAEMVCVYERRWELIKSVRSELYPLLLEGNAIWGEGFPGRFKALWTHQGELRLVVEDHLESMNPRQAREWRDEARKRANEGRGILYDRLADTDEFSQQLDTARKPIEEFLRQWLGRK